MSAQNWNNLLTYIKSKLGFPVNEIELTDEDMINYIKEHTLQEFSNYVPLNRYLVITEEDLITETPMPKYEMKTDDLILDVIDVYYNDDIDMGFETLAAALGVSSSLPAVRNALMMQEQIDIAKYFAPTRFFRFEPPKYLYVLPKAALMLVRYSTEHKDLSTIPPDMYQLFKRLALADIMIWLGAIRSKFEALNTPIGQVMINWQQLYQEGQQIRAEVTQMLNALPPDKLVWIV